MCFLICYLLTFFAFVVCDQESQFCLPWSDIEEKLDKKQFHINCTKDITCLGMSCTFQQFGNEVHSNITLDPCGSLPSLELSIDAPKLNVYRWSKRFYHGDSFNVTDMFGGVFDLQKVNDTFVFGLLLHLDIVKDKASPVWKFIPTVQPHVTYPLFNNIVVPIPPCNQLSSSHGSNEHIISFTTLSSVDAAPFVSKDIGLEYSNCSISNKSCPLNELCQQLNVSAMDGICVCVPNFVRDESGKCVFIPTVLTTTETPGDHPDAPSKTSNSSLLLTAILVPLTVILLMVGVVYTSIKFRICQRMRRRLRVQVYEHVLLGQDEEEEESEGNLSNPVA